jgi:Flp pilus assembly protein TadG
MKVVKMRHRIRKVRMRGRLRRLLRLHTLAGDEQGIQLVELAIVLPVLLVLFAATAEFGRYFYEYTTLAKAARIGTRYLVTAKVNCFEATQAKNLVVYGNTAGTGSPLISGLTTANISVTPNDIACAGGTPPGVPEKITVKITGFKHQPLFDLGGLTNNSTFSLNIDVKPSVTMRYLLTTPLV